MSLENKERNTYNVEPLNSNNYHMWRFRMEILLTEKEVFDMIESQLDENNYATEAARIIARKADNKCKSLIVQCIENSQIDIIRGKSTAYDMWKTFEDLYQNKGLQGQLFLKRKFMQVKLEENEDIDILIKRFDNLLCQLRASGVQVKEEDAVCQLLLSLPKTYETVVTVLENLPPKEVTLEFVKSKLRIESEKRNINYSNTENRNSIRSASFMSNKVIKCFGCGQPGHIQRYCRNSENNQRGRYGNQGSTTYRGRHNYNSSNQHQRGRYTGHRGFRGRFRGNAGGNYVENTTMREDEEGKICFMGNSELLLQKVKADYNTMVFLIDSGCTDHLVNREKYFSELVMLEKPIKIAIAKDKNYLEATGIGNIDVISFIDDKEIECTMKNVLFVPELRHNLLSVKKLEMSQIKVVFENAQVRLYQRNKLINIGSRNNLYEVEFGILKKQCLNSENKNDKTKLWHKRFGHIGFSNLKRVVELDLVEGIDKLEIKKTQFCESCTNGKMMRNNFGTREKSRRLLEIIHSDVCGPINPTSHDGNNYFVTFIDGFSNFVYVYPIKTKGEVLDCFREYSKLVQAKFNLNISTLRCDNGGEYTSNNFKDYCKENGIVIDYTVPYTPQQNGKAERFNRSLMEKARSMIHESSVPKFFWDEAIKTAAYLMNRSPSAILENNTPAEIWHKRKPNVSNLRVFGSTVYYHIPKEKRSKLDFKSEKGMMLGYTNNGYRIWNMKEQKVIFSRDVIFDENCFYFKKEVIRINDDQEIDKQSENKKNLNNLRDLSQTKFEENTVSNDIDENKEPIESNENIERMKSNEISDRNVNDTLDDMTKTRPKRTVNVPVRFNDYEMYAANEAISFVENIPTNYDDLEHRKDKNKWVEAMDREIKFIDDNETWEAVPTPKNTKLLDTKWVYTIKPFEIDEKDRFKARLVVRGFAQERDFTLDEIYSPMARMTTIRTLLAVGNQNRFIFNQLDVKTAFLNGILKEDIYIENPKGITCKEGHVLKLKKSLYGLKQSSKCWNDRINEFLISLHYKRSESDYCLYIKHTKSGTLFLLIYVDDIILASVEQDLIDKCKKELMEGFKMKDKGNLHYFLGLEIEYDRNKGIMRINQNRYTNNILKRFNMEHCKPCSIPIDPKLKLLTIKIEETDQRKPIKELIGCLMYLMLGTRPDISFAINYFSRYQEKNETEVWSNIKRLLRYIQGTKDSKLTYLRSQKELPLTCYVDSDWGGDLADRKSVSGFLIKIYGNTVSWVTRKQRCVALSSTEAELIALSISIQEGIWIKKLLLDMKIMNIKLKVYEDNQACIALIKNPGNNRRVKHIDLKYNYISENVERKEIELEYIPSNRQQADILTKGLASVQFKFLRNLIGLEVKDEN